MRRTSGAAAAVAAASLLALAASPAPGAEERLFLKRYDRSHLARIALPVGGIGTGTVSLGGRGDLRDWEIANRPAKGYDGGGPFFAVRAADPQGRIFTRALMGPPERFQYSGPSGASAANHGLPCFADASFDAGYPFGRVNLADPDLPFKATVTAFNPFVPADVEASGLPIAVLTYEIENTSGRDLKVTVCGVVPNSIGNDGTRSLASKNRNAVRRGRAVQGIFMTSEGVDPKAESFGTVALAVPAGEDATFRTAWLAAGWGTPLLDFWDDLRDDGRLTESASLQDLPRACLAVQATVPARSRRAFRFYITWRFPNRFAWSETVVGNWYATRFADAWEAAESIVPRLPGLERETKAFATAFLASDLPEAVKEAALFNLSTLRTQTVFRTADGRFFAWEGCSDRDGCCWGSCTHVWNYEQATAFLFGEIARSFRETEFGPATAEDGLMSFRVKLPIGGPAWGKAAADGQMGCLMKLYRDWQLSGDATLLRALWPKARKALEFCWIPGGWDADRDGVMEGCQHNTMDVEYFGPNPQMGLWYLGALRAAEEMARAVGEADFARTCRSLFERGRGWIDANLFNGRFYVHKIVPPKDKAAVAPSLLVGMGAADVSHPDYQLGNGCLVDQLVGQLLARISGLGDLVAPANVRTTLKSIQRYNYRPSLRDHFNILRSFALGDEAALLMASYPDGRPKNPFPYFTEVMTGFEYAAAVGMLYEGLAETGLARIADVRARYDGFKRNPYDEAECGHHYGRAMLSWAGVLALTGFHYSGVDKRLTLAAGDGRAFWSNGTAYGTAELKTSGRGLDVRLEALGGELRVKEFVAAGFGRRDFPGEQAVSPGRPAVFRVEPAAEKERGGLR